MLFKSDCSQNEKKAETQISRTVTESDYAAVFHLSFLYWWLKGYPFVRSDSVLWHYCVMLLCETETENCFENHLLPVSSRYSVIFFASLLLCGFYLHILIKCPYGT